MMVPPWPARRGCGQRPLPDADRRSSSFGTNLFWYFVVLLLIIGAIIIIRRLDDSRLGRAWVAMRENEVAAAACGVNIRTQKLWAFSLGAMSGGIAGVTFAYVQQFISPESFTFMESVFVVCIVVLGGMGSIPGVIVGALLIRGVPDLIQGLMVAGVIKLSGRRDLGDHRLPVPRVRPAHGRHDGRTTTGHDPEQTSSAGTAPRGRARPRRRGHAVVGYRATVTSPPTTCDRSSDLVRHPS